MQQWIQKEEWSAIAHASSAHEKMKVLQRKQKLLQVMPCFTHKFSGMKRTKSREFHKHRKSVKSNGMNEEYEFQLELAKKNFQFKQTKVKTKRYTNSAIPYMSRLQNDEKNKKS